MQLFDLETDPGEQIDVTEQHPEVVKRISKLMNAELASVGEVAPVNPSNVQYYQGPGSNTPEIFSFSSKSRI